MLADIVIYFWSIGGLIITTSLPVTAIAVNYTVAILVIIILIIYKKGLGLNRVRVFPLLGYN